MSDSYDASDDEEVRAQEEAARIVRERELNDLRQLVGSTYGQRVLARIFDQFGLNKNAMVRTAGETDDSRVMFKLGQQNVTQFILSEIGHVCSPSELGRIVFSEVDEGDK